MHLITLSSNFQANFSWYGFTCFLLIMLLNYRLSHRHFRLPEKSTQTFLPFDLLFFMLLLTVCCRLFSYQVLGYFQTNSLSEDFEEAPLLLILLWLNDSYLINLIFFTFRHTQRRYFLFLVIKSLLILLQGLQLSIKIFLDLYSWLISVYLFPWIPKWFFLDSN